MAAFKDNVPSSSASEDNAERGVTMAAFTPIPRPAGVRGNPGPFGLLCFGMTTCMLMFVTTTWSSAGFIPVVMSYAMFFGGAGQLIAGILELIKGNTFAGTAFSSYGCFWMGWFLFNYFAVSKITPSVLAVALTGDTLWCGLWGVLTFLFYIVTLRKNGCLQTIFLTLWITFFLLAGGNYSARCKEAAGYVGFFCGSSAIYAAIAMLYQDELGWTLPGMRPTNFI
ncbi:GPR1/FUN34/yaaH family-domain-containing protein [Haematococcus lacustris]